MTWDAAFDEDIIQYLASLGFVAATIDYPNGAYPSNCSQMQTRAKCIYNANNANSAVSNLCSRASADCAGKGVYVAGFSQGANLSSLSASWSANVKGAYLMGNGDKTDCTGWFPSIDLSACMDKSNVALASSRLREVNGEADQCFGVNQAGVQTELQNATGVACPSGSYDGLQADGSGWRIVRNSEVCDRKADHCYFSNGGTCDATGFCNGVVGFDPGWDAGTTLDWQKIQDLNWLAQQVGRGHAIARQASYAMRPYFLIKRRAYLM
jgi:hypothetical protein